MIDVKDAAPEHAAVTSSPPASRRSDALPRETLLLSIPPPRPYDLLIRSLDIGLPSSTPSPATRLAQKLKRGKTPAQGEKGEDVKDWIVRNVDVTCRSGEVLALIGGSGSGKTSLLNAIAGRLGALPILKGEVEFVPSASSRDTALGSEKQADTGKAVGFVRQNDYLLPFLTVRETLSFAAALRLPRSVSREERCEIVEQTILELGLMEVADVVVGGGEGGRKGISGGERRRLSIGCTLVTLPSVLILDEPTSGLDAFTSHLLLLLLSHLASRGRTVILSLHAPRSDAFAVFDRLCVLTKGEVAFSGPTKDSLAWFSSRGYECGAGVNPLDFLVDTTSVDYRDPEKEEESRERVKVLVGAWEARSLSEKAEQQQPSRSHALLRTISSRPSQHSIPLNDLSSDARRPGILEQTAILLHRSHLNVYRNVPQLLGFCAQAVIIGLLMGLTFYQLDESPADVQSLKNVSFQLLPAYFYLTQVYWIYSYCAALVIFDREREDRLYAVVPWVLSEYISVLAPSILAPFIYTIILFCMADLRPDPYAESLFTVFAVCMLFQWVVQGLALLSVSIVRQFAVASLICNALSLFQTMAAGFLLTHVPPWVSWIRWISMNFYGYRVLAPTLLKGREFACPGVTGDARIQCNGDAVLRSLLIPLDVNIGVWFAGLVVLFIVEHVLAAVMLHFYHPGGVKYARPTSARKGKESGATGDMDLPRTRVDVEINHLSLRWTKRAVWPFSSKAVSKTILRHVSATFPSGEVSAIIGPSGAGKSTVLQLLANRKLNAGSFAHFKADGAVLFNGNVESDGKRVAFVEQDDDYHLPGLTVRETLRFSAILRLPTTLSRKRKLARAEEVLLMLGLNDCANVLVGGPLVKGISGGEKRRLSLAVQMLSDPEVLVVDEPTSGLDSFIAANVMESLTNIARTGRTVIVTIHQPRSEIFKAFDNLTVLAKGGVLVYSGKTVGAMPWLEAQGYPLPTKSFNPADHILDIVSVDSRPGRETESAQRVASLTAAWRDQVQKVDLVEERATRNDSHAASTSMGSNSPFYIAYPVVLHRMVLNLWRQPETFWNRLTQAPLLGVLFLLFYTRLTHGPSGAQDRIGVTLENVNSIPFVGLLNGIAVYPFEQALFRHERTSGARYSSAAFLVAYSTLELSMTVMASWLYALIMNVAVGEQTSVRIYFQFATTIFCCLSFGESIAIIFCLYVSQMGVAVSLVSTALACCCQISGLVSLSMPLWLASLAWATPMKGATKVQFINEVSGLRFNCDAASIQSGACVATSGDQLLTAFGFEDLNTARFVGIMLATTFAWRVLAWACLHAQQMRR